MPRYKKLFEEEIIAVKKFILKLCFFCSITPAFAADPGVRDSLNFGTAEVDPANPERFSILVYNSSSTPIYCKDAYISALMSEPNLCSLGDPLINRWVGLPVPMFNVNPNTTTNLEGLGREGRKIYENLRPGFKGEVTYCSAQYTLNDFVTCQRGCMPGTKEKDKQCLPVCVDGSFYGTHTAYKSGCWYYVRTCGSDGTFDCAKSYLGGRNCPDIIDEPNVSCRDEWM